MLIWLASVVLLAIWLWSWRAYAAYFELMQHARPVLAGSVMVVVLVLAHVLLVLALVLANQTEVLAPVYEMLPEILGAGSAKY